MIGLAVLLAGFWLLHLNQSQPAYLPADISTDHPLQIGYSPQVNAISGLSTTSNQLLPWIDLPEAFFDFGAITTPDPISHQFVIKNKGEGPLVIEQAYTTCGCTTADLTGSIIPAGKVSLVTLHFIPVHHWTAGATVRRGLILLTNDPLHPMVEIWIQAQMR